MLTDRAWRASLRPAEASGRRNLYLDKGQRRALLAALPKDVAAFCRGLCQLPLRPGALAALWVADYDGRRCELAIGKDKARGNLKILVQGETAAMLAEHARNKFPTLPLFARADGKAWESYMWKEPIKEAALAAGLPAGVVAYTLRHSTITDRVQSGLDLLTVAQVSGTSVAMIEKHYGHLQRDKAAALAGLALQGTCNASLDTLASNGGQSRMIRSFRNKGLAELYRTGKSAKVRPDLQARAVRRMDALNAASDPETLNIPGFNFHPLKGHKPTRYTIHINGPWCITFAWADGDALDVDLEHYH